MLRAHQDDLIVLDHKLEEYVWYDSPLVQLVEDLKKAKLTIYEAKSRSKKKLKRWHAVHKVRSTASLSDLRNHYMVMEKIRENKAYATMHHFDVNEWDIAHLGFLQGYNNIHMGPQATLNRLQNELSQINPAYPAFKIATARIRPAQSTKKSKFSIQAYKIQCPRSHAKELSKLLTSGPFRKTMSFIPYAYKQTKPDMFLNALRVHNKHLEDTWIVKIHGFTDAAMQTCKDKLSDHIGVIDVVPSYLGSERGEWKILVEKSKIDIYYKWLAGEISTITQQLPDSIKEATPTTYPPWGINSRPPIFQQDDATQADADSYATMLSNAMSCATAQFEDIEIELPEDMQTPSTPTYAEAATATQMSDLTSARKSSRDKKTPTNTNAQQADSEAAINKIKVESEAEIQRLRDELNKLHLTVTNQQELIAQQHAQQRADSEELKTIMMMILAKTPTTTTDGDTQPSPTNSTPTTVSNRIDQPPRSPTSNKRQAVMNTPTKFKRAPAPDSPQRPGSTGQKKNE
jgi:hypothetical protein